MEFIYLILAAAALIWAGVYAVRGSLWFGCLVFLVVGYCFGHDLLHFYAGAVPLTLDRIVLGTLVVIYVIQRQLGKADPKPIAWVDVTMFAFGGLLIVSTFLSDWRVDIPGKVSPVWRLVAGYIMPIGLYWLARQSRLDRHAMIVIYTVLTLLGVYAVVTAIAEVTQQWWLVFPSYIADPNVGIHFGRARGPTLQSQSMGFYLDVCLLAAWALRPYLNRFGQLLIILLVPAFLIAIAVTYTRCVWIGLALGVMVVAALSLPKTWRPLVGVAALAGVLLVAVQSQQLIEIERESGSEASRSSVECRGSFTYVSWKIFLEHPILGVGYGQFIPNAKDYLSDRTVDLPLEVIRGQPNHSTYLALLTETGLVGLGLFLAMVTGWVLSAWRLWRNESAPDWARRQAVFMLGVLAVCIGPSLFFDLTYSPEDHWLVFFLVGTTMGLAQATLGSGAAKISVGNWSPADVFRSLFPGRSAMRPQA